MVRGRDHPDAQFCETGASDGASNAKIIHNGGCGGKQLPLILTPAAASSALTARLMPSDERANAPKFSLVYRHRTRARDSGSDVGVRPSVRPPPSVGLAVQF